MGQCEILEYLRKVKRPVSRNELANALSERPQKITARIAKLLEFKEVKCIEISRTESSKFYNCKRRMRLYYI